MRHSLFSALIHGNCVPIVKWGHSARRQIRCSIDLTDINRTSAIFALFLLMAEVVKNFVPFMETGNFTPVQ